MKLLIQFVISFYLDNQKPLPPWLQNRLDRDASLRQWVASESQLTDQLTKHSTDLSQISNPQFEQSVWAIIEAQSDVPSQKESTSSWPRLALFIPTACILSFVLFIQYKDREPTSKVTTVSIIQQPETVLNNPKQRTDSEVEILLTRISRSVDQPLENEFTLVCDDVKASLRFVVANFAPEWVDSQRNLPDEG